MKNSIQELESQFTAKFIHIITLILEPFFFPN